MKFYIENFALRLVFCILTCVAATNLGMFVRASLIAHTPFVFSVVQGFLIPLARGVFTTFMWRPKVR